MIELLLCIFIAYTFVSLFVHIRRNETYNDIELLYTKLRLKLIEHREDININHNMKLLLAIRKAVYLHKEDIDFKLMVKSNNSISEADKTKIKKKLISAEKKLPEDIRKLILEFDKSILKAIDYNSLSTSNLPFISIGILLTVIIVGFSYLRKVFTFKIKTPRFDILDAPNIIVQKISQLEIINLGSSLHGLRSNSLVLIAKKFIF